MSIEATGPRPVSLIKSFDPKFNSLLKCGKSRGSNRESERVKQLVTRRGRRYNCLGGQSITSYLGPSDPLSLHPRLSFQYSVLKCWSSHGSPSHPREKEWEKIVFRARSANGEFSPRSLSRDRNREKGRARKFGIFPFSLLSRLSYAMLVPWAREVGSRQLRERALMLENVTSPAFPV